MEKMSSSGSLPPTKNASKLMDTEPGGEASQYEGQQVIFDKKSGTVCSQLTQSGKNFSSLDARSQAKEEIDERERNEKKIRLGKSSVSSPSSWSMSENHDRDSEKTIGSMGRANQGITFGNGKK